MTVRLMWTSGHVMELQDGLRHSHVVWRITRLAEVGDMPIKTAKVLVIGANGALGRAVCSVFAERGWHVTGGVRDSDMQDVSCGTYRADLDDPDSVANAMAKADLTVNTVPKNFCAETIALGKGHRLLSLAITPTSAQRALRNIHQRAAGTVIFNAGLGPGVTNLVVADLLTLDPAGQGKIVIAVPLPWNNYHGKEGVRLVHQYMTRSGRHGSYSGSHETVKIRFPEPIGRKTCVGWAERDAGWVKRLAGGRTVRAYCYLDSSLLNTTVVAMNSFNSLHHLPLWPFTRDTEGRRIPTAEPVSIAVGLQKDDILYSRVIECSGWYLSAARASELMAREFLSDDSLTGRGCIDSDEAFGLTRLAPQFEQQSGIKIIMQDPQPASNVFTMKSSHKMPDFFNNLALSMATPR